MESYSVATRTHEFGIRVALGASYRDVVKLVGKETLVVVGAGAVVGLGAATVLVRFIESHLYEVSGADPLTIGAVMMVLLVAALLAGYAPARRAATADPMTALRRE